jgi:hypothetical protein
MKSITSTPVSNTAVLVIAFMPWVESFSSIRQQLMADKYFLLQLDTM